MFVNTCQKVASYFNWSSEKVETLVKTNHRVARRIQTSLTLGYGYDGDHLFSIENELKYVIKDHVKAYLGMRYSIDGW